MASTFTETIEGSGFPLAFKLKQGAVRLVQYSPYAVTGAAKDGSWRGTAEPVDTHLFLNGEESDETQ